LKRRRLRFEDRILLDVALAAVPAVAVALALLWPSSLSLRTCWTLTAVIAIGWAGFAFAARARLVRPLHTLSNMLAGLRDEDTSIRGKSARPDDALGQVMTEVNALADALRDHKLGVAETVALLAKVSEETEVAMFAFDGEGRLRIVNRAGAALLGGERAQPGRAAADLGLAGLLAPGAPPTARFADRTYQVRRSLFRQAGRPLTLLALADVSRALREEERVAWQRLVRVLSHEINNSLAPISSIAASLRLQLARDPAAAADDAARGLEIIGRRADSLSRLMSAYARLARLPPPERAPVEVAALALRVAGLEWRAAVAVAPGPPTTLHVDAGQLEQLLINLVKNAVDATRENGGEVEIAWRVDGDRLTLTVRDDGPGLSDTGNLFVPFYTTKPDGSGIGLALSRQIAEAHGGTLTLENRIDRTGCEARLTLPLGTAERPDPGSAVPDRDRPAARLESARAVAVGPAPAQEPGEP
jgi:two-component system, NtrC family, nitrogen regulation sensor histidine kinase NtrY